MGTHHFAGVPVMDPPVDSASPDARSATCTLALTYASVGAARDFVRGELRRWECEALADDVALVASELVANALRHGVHGAPGSASEAEDGVVEIRLVSTPSQLVCEVHDPSTDLPVHREPDLTTASGRGLHLIASLSTRWGCTSPQGEGARPGGKSVWALFSPVRA